MSTPLGRRRPPAGSHSAPARPTCRDDRTEGRNVGITSRANGVLRESTVLAQNQTRKLRGYGSCRRQTKCSSHGGRPGRCDVAEASPFGSGRRWGIVTLQIGADAGWSAWTSRPTSDVGAVASSPTSAPDRQRQHPLPYRRRGRSRDDGSRRSHGREANPLLSMQAPGGPRGRPGSPPSCPHRRRADAL